MQYDVESPAQYLDTLEDDWRKDTLVQLRKIIRANPAALKEDIQYKMLAYFLNGKTVFHLNAQKNYVSLYVGDHRKIDPNQEYLEGLNIGKGCIRFSKSIIVSETKIEAFIAKTIELAKKGKNIDC